MTRQPKKKQSGKPPIPAGKPPVPLLPKFLPPWQTGQAGPLPRQAAENEHSPDAQAYNFDHVPPKVKATRRLFVGEYIKDFNGSAAICRLGWEYQHPAQIATNWLKEPYTQYMLDKYLDEAKDEAFINRNKVLAGLVREANSYGLDSSGASRVSALGKLAKILGLETVKIDANVRIAGGVMLVPLADNPDEWEANAKAAQAKLRADAKTDS